MVHKSSYVLLFTVLLFAAIVMGCGPSAAPAPAVVGTLPASPEREPKDTPVPTLPAVPIGIATLSAPQVDPTPTGSPAAAPTVAKPSGAGDFQSGLKPIERKPSDLRAAWVHDNALATPAKIDEVIRRAELGHMNVIVANVYEQGMTLYDSALVNKHPVVQGDFNPLPYLVEQAHQRGIQVHAWFVNGPVDFKGKSDLIAKHPEWAIVGPDGKTSLWMNFTRPDVRQFYSDLMWEVVARYGVDGLFFDFTRYPGPEWGFDSYSTTTFNSTHDFKLEELRYPDLPAYGYFEASPVLEPATAQVLAKFSNGTPALTINRYGQGQVILLNWRASGRESAANSEIMRRSIKQLLKEGGQVYSYKPDGKLDDNAKQSVEEMGNWLRDLGYPAQEVVAQQVEEIPTNSVLVVTYGFDITPEGAANMADWVNRGGGLVFNDGPVRSINLDSIRALTGMQKRGKHFEEWTFLLPAANSPLIPTSTREANLGLVQQRDAQWRDFRKQGVNTLIKGIHERIKSQYPQVDVSVTVTSDQSTASQKTMQDWRAWLEGGYVDYIVPRGYVEEVEELETILAAWQPALQKYQRITLGVSTFSGKHSERVLKSPSQLQDEINRARQAGSYGIMLWNLDYVNEEQLKMLAAGPFR